EAAAGRLRAGEVDAFFATVGAPAREGQRPATLPPIPLASFNPGAAGDLGPRPPGLVRLVVPANTYPDQKEDVPTIAPTALLVTHADVTDAEVAVVLGLVFENPDYLAAGSAQGPKISKAPGLRGIPVPLHPGGSRYFGPEAPPPTPSAPPKS